MLSTACLSCNPIVAVSNAEPAEFALLMFAVSAPPALAVVSVPSAFAVSFVLYLLKRLFTVLIALL